MIFTGMALSAEDQSLADRYGAAVFYKPTRYLVLLDHITRSLAMQPTLADAIAVQGDVRHT